MTDEELEKLTTGVSSLVRLVRAYSEIQSPLMQNSSVDITPADNPYLTSGGGKSSIASVKQCELNA
ncbi:MAG: hypothetical protein V7K69_21435 [Nostoc sp.]|uniref:hypothetical protein n=1 Tax=Nostoc sp. TaxID=1180 RepID=UPI002FF9B749